MWLPLAILLSAFMLYWWFALCGTIWCGFNAFMALWAGNFIRASIWGCCCAAGVFWLNQEDWIPNPHQFDAWLKGSAWIVGFGAFLTFIRFCHRHRHRHQQAAQIDAPSLNINVKFSPSWDIGDCAAPERRDPGHDLVAVKRIGRRSPTRRNIGAKQSPRRISGPTIIDQ
jgi:hypothetical protein